MNRDLASALIGISFIATIITLFIIFSFFNKAKKKKKLAAFLSMAVKQKLILSYYELMEEFSIGLDKKNLKIYYIKSNEHKEYVFDLMLVKKCELVNVSRNISIKSKNISVVDRLELVLKYKDSTKTDTIIEFYNIDYSPHVNNELHLLEKWVQLINSLL